jgi:hypothetical protein
MQYKSYVNKHIFAKLKPTENALVFNSEPIDLATLLFSTADKVEYIA